MASYPEQRDLVREQFTRTAQVFGDYAVTSRAGEAERLARHEARRLMEASIPSDAARFHPRYKPGDSGKSDLGFMNTTFFIAGEKS